MQQIMWRFCGAVVVGIVSLAASTAAAQQSTSTEVRAFEVVAVDGNRVVVKGQRGTQEYTVPDDFRVTVDGRQVSVRELQPGMKGTATITTTTTVKPVHVTEVRNGEVMQVVGNSIIVRGQNGIHMYSEADATRRGIRIVKDGRPVNFTDIRRGDRLTATIITEGAPEVLTERQVQARLSSAGASGAAASGASAAGGAAGPPGSGSAAGTGVSSSAGVAPAPARRLPKTASPLPLIGLLGALSLLAGAALTAIRRRRQG
jgi:LPXTG-motif cell wall-anchored protein